MKKSYRAEYLNEHGEPCVLIASVRYDDECKNGHNTFAITGELYDRTDYLRGEPSQIHAATGEKLWLGSCGCVHDEIAAHLPELAPFIKWHLTSTDGPMHYVANTMYHADEHGPRNALVYFTDSDPLGLQDDKERLLCYANSDDAKKAEGVTGYRVQWDEKTAKVANLEAARRCAIWPDATLEQLRDKAALDARLPGLLAEFRAAVEYFGFTY